MMDNGNMDESTMVETMGEPMMPAGHPHGANPHVGHPLAEGMLRETTAAVLRGRPVLHVCGLSHVRASIGVREHYALGPDACQALTRRFLENKLSSQFLILSTCNRTEFYAFGSSGAFASELRAAFLAIGAPEGAGFDPAGGPPPLYEYEGVEAVRHLFAVGAGLDSLILGENQIKQQIGQAYAAAREWGSCGPDLSRLIEAAHRTGKRIRTETSLNEGTLCVGKAAVLKGEQRLGGLAGKVCMVIGAGKVGRIAARAIAERHPGRLWIINRTVEKAGEIAGELGAEAYGLDDLPCLLPEAEFIIGAAYAPELLLDRALYLRQCAGRVGAGRVCMVDAAVPRIIDRALGELAEVELFDIEHMEEIIEENRQRRLDEAQRAWQIVEDEVEKHGAACQAAELGPVIRRLHEQVDQIFAEEQAALTADAPPEWAPKVEAAHRRIKQRLMHEVISEIKARLMD